MQGFNMGRYVPPDQEGIYTGNQLHKKNPPGIHGSTQTVRFEMPFGIFCLTCDGHIAQGVRFNAEKKKIGKYHTTPIFSFRMRHVSCSGWIEVQTDPKNTRYVVTEGGKKKGGDEEEGAAVVGEIHIRDPNMPGDPFAAVEKKVVDKAGVKKSTERIEELRGLSDRQWLDPYEHSRKMRRVFREKRKELQAKDAANEAIRDRAGLHIELLDEIPEDKTRAQLVEFGPDYGDKVEEARTKPLFATTTTATTTTARDSAKKASKWDTAGKTKAQLAAGAAREKLQSEIRRNTRARVDPFLSTDKPKVGLEFKLLKRKYMEAGPETEPELQSDDARDGEQPGEPPKKTAAGGIGRVQPGVSLGLGAYESDDD
ncbi:CWC16 protein [Tuber indicum]|nr:CWC16 protein [Tuber indicum]